MDKYGNYVLINGVYRYQLPEPPQMERDILFAGLPVKEQFWRRTPTPSNWQDLSVKRQGEFIEREVDRMFVTGAWFANKGNLVYLPPSVYTYYNYWKMKDGEYPSFRYSQYYEQLFEEFAESLEKCIGTFGFKKRRDGRTTRRMARKVWKAIQPKNANKWCGLQSKTGPDARDVCWETLITGYNSLPSWVKPDQSGSSDPKKKLEFRKPAKRLSRTNVREVLDETDRGLNTTIDYRDTTENAYDGQELLDLSLDEAAKWEKARVIKALTTYVRCVYKDGKKVGHIHAFSSPSEKLGKAHDASVTMWEMGDPAKSIRYESDGSLTMLKKSWFILRIFTGALEGYGEACDKYGVCDQDLAAEMINEEIANAEPEMRDELKRQMPFSIDDILTNEQDMIFENAKAMQARKNFVANIDFKDYEAPLPQEPKYIFGNLEWKDGIEYTEALWKPSKNQNDFSFSGRFAFQYLPPEEMRNKLKKKRKLQNDVWVLPDDYENIIGVDPYDYRRTEGNKKSEGAAIGGQALNLYDHGRKNRLWFAYLFRPPSPTIFYDDMIKASFFCTAGVQVESKNKNIINHFEDNNCFDLLLAKSVAQPKSEHKGNATSTSLIDEICTLLDTYYGDDENIEDLWLDFVYGDNLKFNPSNTLLAHLTMAQGQMLLGFMKRRLAARMMRKKNNTTLGKEISKTVANIYGI